MAQEDQLKVLRTNIAAIQALVATVAGTLGPKGLDILLVDEAGHMVLTNDGIEILRQSDFQHPAARLAVAALKAQEQQVGDGTTTATVLAGALLTHSLRVIEQGVPVNLLLKGLERGIDQAIAHLRATAQSVSIADPALYQVVQIAARGEEQIADLLWQAAQHLGSERLQSAHLNLGDWVLGRVGAYPQLIPGVVIGKRPLNAPAIPWQATGKVLVLADALEPETLDAQTLGTDRGFSVYLEAQQRFQQALQVLVNLGVRLVVAEKGFAPAAEDFLYAHHILALPRVLSRDRERISLLTGATPIKSSLLYREDPTPHLGQADLSYDPNHAQVIFQNGQGEPQATLLVGALSAEVTAEQERIATDACGALQAALRSGVVTGGGIAELGCRNSLQMLLDTTEDLSRYGIQVVHTALAQPLEQIILNSGYAPLEKLALIETAQRKTGNPDLGLDCDTGMVVDLKAQGVLDPAAVKIQALRVAGEIALRVLRIQTLIRRRTDAEP